MRRGAGQDESGRKALYVGLLALAHMAVMVEQFATAAVAGPLKSTFKLSDTGLGALQGLAIALPYVVVVLPLGRLADRLPRQRLIVAGLATWTVGAFACAFSRSVPELWAARGLIGVGQAAFFPASLALLGSTFTGPATARAISVFTAGATLGKSVALLAAGLVLSLAPGLPVVQALFGHQTWRCVLALTATPNLLLLLGFALVRAPEQRSPAARPMASPGKGGVVLGAPFLTFALVALAPIVLIQAAAAWSPTLYVRHFHLAAAQAAALVGGVVLVASPIGHLAGGQLTALALEKGVGPGRLIAACLTGAAVLGLAFCFAGSIPLSLAGYGLAILLLGMAAPAGLTGVGALAPPGRLAGATAAYMCLATLVGVGLGPTVVGAMSDAVFGGGGGLQDSLAALFLAVPLACVAITLSCGSLWRLSTPANPAVKFADR